MTSHRDGERKDDSAWQDMESVHLQCGFPMSKSIHKHNGVDFDDPDYDNINYHN